VRWVAILVVAACGRIGFDPIATSIENPMDAHDGDGPPGGFKDAPTDASACAFALVAPLNTRVATSTCLGHDLIDGCGPPGTQEVVFAFTPAQTNGYNFRAFDPGTNNVSNSTARLATGCGGPGSCAGILGVTVNAGETAYLVVEAAAGGCTNIEFEAQ
jgi:hypothetical protein